MLLNDAPRCAWRLISGLSLVLVLLAPAVSPAQFIRALTTAEK